MGEHAFSLIGNLTLEQLAGINTHNTEMIHKKISYGNLPNFLKWFGPSAIHVNNNDYVFDDENNVFCPATCKLSTLDQFIVTKAEGDENKSDDALFGTTNVNMDNKCELQFIVDVDNSGNRTVNLINKNDNIIFNQSKLEVIPIDIVAVIMFKSIYEHAIDLASQIHPRNVEAIKKLKPFMSSNIYKFHAKTNKRLSSLETIVTSTHETIALNDLTSILTNINLYNSCQTDSLNEKKRITNPLYAIFKTNQKERFQEDFEINTKMLQTNYNLTETRRKTCSITEFSIIQPHWEELIHFRGREKVKKREELSDQEGRAIK
jgi:hypothetical protein